MRKILLALLLLPALAEAQVISPFPGGTANQNIVDRGFRTIIKGIILPTNDTTLINTYFSQLPAGTPKDGVFARIGNLPAWYLNGAWRVWGGGGSAGISSISLVMPSGFTVTPGTLTNNGTFTVTANGTSGQYFTGTGALATFPPNVSFFTNDAGYVPGVRTLTINGTTYDLSANRSWVIPGGSADSGTFQTNFRADTSRTRQDGQLLSRVKYTDTAGMLSPYASAIGLRVRYSDTAAMLAAYGTAIGLRVKYSDTAGMLAAYGSAIGLRVRYADTANMLAPYGTAIGLRLRYTDTAGMLSNIYGLINGRVKYTDTAGMLANLYSISNTKVRYSDTSTMLANLYSISNTKVRYSDTSTMLANLYALSNTKQAQLNGTGFVQFAGTTPSYVPTIPIGNGGTGATSASAARAALGTNDAANITTGNMAASQLATGTQTSGYVVKLVAGVPTWQPDLNSGGGSGSVDTTTATYGVPSKYQLDTAKLAIRDEYMKLPLGRGFTTVGCLHANSGTTLQVGGTGLIGTVAGNGTATNNTGSNKSTSNLRTSYSSYIYTTTAATDQMAGISATFLAALLTEGGYYMSATVAWGALPTGYRMMIGFRGGASSFPSSEPSAWTSTPMVLFGKDAGDADVKIMTRATGTGTSTKTSTGFNPTVGNIYEFIVDVPPGAASASFRIYERTSTTSRSLVYSNTVTTAIPTAGQFLSPQCTTNTGTSTTAIVMSFYKMFVTADL